MVKRIIIVQEAYLRWIIMKKVIQARKQGGGINGLREIILIIQLALLKAVN
jgi:hypothetical protein